MRRKKLSAEESFEYLCRSGRIVKCRHVRKKGQKNLYLRLQRDGTVRISTPWRVSEAAARDFLEAKEGWIEEKLEHRAAFSKEDPSLYEEGCRIWYLGKEYPLRYETAASCGIEIECGEAVFRAPGTDEFSRALNGFYLRSAESLLTERVRLWSDRMRLYPAEVRYRRYRSRWGCCSAGNVITLNTALIKYDLPLIDYVIIHELAHIRHKDHKREFWELVERFAPDYRSLRRELV